jgi:hypothetical protein
MESVVHASDGQSVHAQGTVSKVTDAKKFTSRGFGIRLVTSAVQVEVLTRTLNAATAPLVSCSGGSDDCAALAPIFPAVMDTDIISTEEPHDTRTVSFAYNTICTIEHDFIGGFASTNPPCPLHKLCVHMDQGKTYSLTVLQQE